ncbi:hypothetical protein J8273_5669 [Carpediemonas membranifera]|uniref:Uncharacterized protein n=1 Tax=Carpediemonas membranifera TaxID=201153 RepID=A0A8J6B2N8_9EUKA|nr:hypothetical protein J8273_5669 [Carpediemonas membranifera]|eukprot:KAG9392959.1 hypothetical protein J8273_5669 [Carpediemonas membranifera]
MCDYATCKECIDANILGDEGCVYLHATKTCNAGGITEGYFGAAIHGADSTHCNVLIPTTRYAPVYSPYYMVTVMLAIAVLILSCCAFTQLVMRFRREFKEASRKRFISLGSHVVDPVRITRDLDGGMGETMYNSM